MNQTVPVSKVPRACFGVEVYPQSSTTGQLLICEHNRGSEEEVLPVCGGFREHELALEGLAGFLMNGYGGMSTPGGRNHLDKMTEVWTSKDGSGNGKGLG